MPSHFSELLVPEHIGDNPVAYGEADGESQSVPSDCERSEREKHRIRVPVDKIKHKPFVLIFKKSRYPAARRRIGIPTFLNGYSMEKLFSYNSGCVFGNHELLVGGYNHNVDL